MKGKEYMEFTCGSCGYRFFREIGYGTAPGSFCPECGALTAKQVNRKIREFWQMDKDKDGEIYDDPPRLPL